MLRAAPKGEVTGAIPVSLPDDRVLRAAFGRFGGTSGAREAAACVVARYQQRGSGCWFLCDCRPGAGRPSVLVPVQQTHIRRHEHVPWPVHCETCDFFRDPDEQRAITASYAPPSASKPMRLIRPLGRVASEAPVSRIDGASRHTARPGLARLLIQLTTQAGLQVMASDWQPSPLVDQVKAVWSVAQTIEIDSGIKLADFFCTSPARLNELAAKVGMAPVHTFSRTRPHGVPVVRLAGIGHGTVQPVSGEPIPVRGRLAVFGERFGPARETIAERGARVPYLAACVVARAEDGGAVEVQSVYAHPIVSPDHLMLVDSDMERRSLFQLRRLQLWLGDKRGIPVAIEKPLYDLLRDDGLGSMPRPPCIPDFIVRASGAHGAVTSVVAETMGFSDREYRERKERMHPVMMQAADAAAVIPHDFHQPEHQPQEWRDKRFWREVRWALTGPDPAATPLPPKG